jgi:hypothetical protein
LTNRHTLFIINPGSHVGSSHRHSGVEFADYVSQLTSRFSM